MLLGPPPSLVRLPLALTYLPDARDHQPHHHEHDDYVEHPNCHFTHVTDGSAHAASHRCQISPPRGGRDQSRAG